MIFFLIIVPQKYNMICWCKIGITVPLSNRHYNIIKHKPHDINEIFFKNKLQFVSSLRKISYTFSTLIVVPCDFCKFVWLFVYLLFFSDKINAKHNYLYNNNSKINGIYTDYFLSLTNCYVLNRTLKYFPDISPLSGNRK